MELISQIAAGVFLGGLGLMAFRAGLNEGRFHDESGQTMPVWALLCLTIPPLCFALVLWLYG